MNLLAPAAATCSAALLVLLPVMAEAQRYTTPKAPLTTGWAVIQRETKTGETEVWMVGRTEGYPGVIMPTELECWVMADRARRSHLEETAEWNVTLAKLGKAPLPIRYSFSCERR